MMKVAIRRFWPEIVGTIIGILLALVSACGDNVHRTPWVELLPDAPTPATDARVCEPNDAGGACCAYLDDHDALAACMHVPPGFCGVAACRQPDCTWRRAEICTPADPVDAAIDVGIDVP